MSTATEPVLVKIGQEHFEAFEVDGERMGDMHWLLPPADDDNSPVATIWQALPGDVPDEIPYVFHGNEMWCILEGTIDVTYDDGRRYTLSAGDVGAFPKGGTATLRLTTPFKKAYMVA